jgi:hypothetical protein
MGMNKQEMQMHRQQETQTHAQVAVHLTYHRLLDIFLLLIENEWHILHTVDLQ